MWSGTWDREASKVEMNFYWDDTNLMGTMVGEFRARTSGLGAGGHGDWLRVGEKMADWVGGTLHPVHGDKGHAGDTCILFCAGTRATPKARTSGKPSL